MYFLIVSRSILPAIKCTLPIKNWSKVVIEGQLVSDGLLLFFFFVSLLVMP